MNASTRVIFGLGNAPLSYHKQRHNIGALTLATLMQDLQEKTACRGTQVKIGQLSVAKLSLSKNEVEKLLSNYNSREDRVAPTDASANKAQKQTSSYSKDLPHAAQDLDLLFLFPQSYMNHSGAPIKQLMRFKPMQSSALLVLHDEIDLIWNDVRLKQGGGHRGHNGLRDIIAKIGPDFCRIRIGVGRPPCREEVASYVLSNLSQEQAKEVPLLCAKIQNLFYEWLFFL